MGNVDLTARGSRLLWGFARLADGVELATARAELLAIGARLASAYPQTNASFDLRAAPLADSFFRDARRPLWLLLGGSWFVLLIGCANVANLLLVRSTARSREFAVRLAIGASRGRVVRQLLAESVVLAFAGAAAGLILAGWLTPALVAASGLTLPAFAEARFDRHGARGRRGHGVGVRPASFGLAPIWRAFRTSVRDGIATGNTHARRSTTGLWLAGVEVTAAFVLTAGALMMLQSFSALTSTGLAFRSDHLLTVRLELPQDRYATPAARARFGEALRERAAAIPGVQAAILWGPSMFSRSTWISFVAPTDRVVADNERVMLWRHSTNPGGLRDLGIALTAGRDFAVTDTLDTPSVAILSEAAARQLWPAQDPIGRQFRTGSGAAASTVTVVGVAADARHRGRFRFSEGAAAHEPQLDVYFPYAQRSNGLLTLGVRTTGAPSGAIKDVAAAIAAIDPALPAYDIAPLDDRLRLEERSVGFASLLLNLYGGLALLLAAIGVYGVLAATVASRLRELGIRAALGAAPHRLQLAIVRQGLVVTLSAIAAGVVVTAALASSMRALFFDASVADPRALGGAAALLASVAIAASFFPARRASRIDPVKVLKIDSSAEDTEGADLVQGRTEFIDRWLASSVSSADPFLGGRMSSASARTGILVAQPMCKRRVDCEIRNCVATWCPGLARSAVVPCQPGRLRFLGEPRSLLRLTERERCRLGALTEGSFEDRRVGVQRAGERAVDGRGSQRDAVRGLFDRERQLEPALLHIDQAAGRSPVGHVRQHQFDAHVALTCRERRTPGSLTIGR